MCGVITPPLSLLLTKPILRLSGILPAIHKYSGIGCLLITSDRVVRQVAVLWYETT